MTREMLLKSIAVFDRCIKIKNNRVANKREVVKYIDGVEVATYESAIIAAKLNDIAIDTISKNMRGILKTCKGAVYEWREL